MNTIDEDITSVVDRFDTVRTQIATVVLGQNDVVDLLLIALLADGHVLLEGVPGVAKTLLARALSSSLDLDFRRLQFTPDLMPSDIVGTRVWNPQVHAFELKKGPLFSELVLADEINRTPPKTQAALLEAMEERQITLDGETLPLDDSFFVIATENPLEFEGTYPLPEAQTDRFLMKVFMAYPPREAELLLLQQDAFRAVSRKNLLAPVVDKTMLAKVRALVNDVRVDDEVREYVLALVYATRESNNIKLGASPRAGLMLLRCARACALLMRRSFVTPDDVKHVFPSVMRHRLHLSSDAELDGLDAEAVITEILSRTPIRGTRA